MDLPRLRAMMGGYFHQDYDLFGEAEGAILAKYARCSWPDDLDRTIAEIERLPALPTAGSLAAYVAAVRPMKCIIADTDSDLRDWLVIARGTLIACRAGGA